MTLCDTKKYAQTYIFNYKNLGALSYLMKKTTA